MNDLHAQGVDAAARAAHEAVSVKAWDTLPLPERVHVCRMVKAAIDAYIDITGFTDLERDAVLDAIRRRVRELQEAGR